MTTTTTRHFLPLLATFAIACSSAPIAASSSSSCLLACDAERVHCENIAANTCAHCCEVQPFVDETKDGTMFTRPIVACSSSALPPASSWSVSWCMNDCEAEGVTTCAPAFDSCNVACP